MLLPRYGSLPYAASGIARHVHPLVAREIAQARPFMGRNLGWKDVVSDKWVLCLKMDRRCPV
jgi:hypothetical protein